MILLDNNILARLTNDGHRHCQLARNAIHRLIRRGETLVICPQAIYEFWAVATRSKDSNGLGLNETQSMQWIAFFRRRFLFLPDSPALAEALVSLVKAYGVKGFRSHDARYVAFAQVEQIVQLMTFNSPDFRDLPITLIDPETL